MTASPATRPIRNGVDTETMFSTLDLIKTQPEPAILLGMRGALGVDEEPRNGFERIRVSFRVAGDASAEKLREIVERAKARSAVYDMVTNGVPVDVEVATG